MRAILPLAAALSLGLAMPAAAAVVINVGSAAVAPEESLVFDSFPALGPVAEGVSDLTGTLVSLTGGETLWAPGGVPRVDTKDGFFSSTFTFNGLSNQLAGFDLVDAGLAFTSTEFRLVRGTATEVTLTFVDTAGQVFTDTFDYPPRGWFNAVAIDGQLIDHFSISANGTIGDIRIARIGGVQPLAAVPEAGAWAMMILGFSGLGAMLRRRRAALA